MTDSWEESKQTDDRTKYVLSAFIRDVHSVILSACDNQWNNIYTIIPNAIVMLLLSYIGSVCSINHGIYEWRITDPKLLKSIVSANNRAQFESSEFEIGKLKWKIELFPNGNHEQRVGLFGVFLKCMKLPIDWKYILILRTIECKETATKYTFITKCVSEQSKGWASGSLFLQDTKHLKSLTFTIKIRILVIVTENKQLGNYPQDINIYYRYKSPYKYISNKWNFKISWKINSELMKKFKSCRHGQIFEQESIIDDMWCLRCCPKGMKGGIIGETVLILQLCCLPFNISKLETNYSLSCYAYDSNIVFNSNTVTMHYENSVVKWNNDLLFFIQIKDFDEIEFRANIDIKSKIDIDGNRINKPNLIDAQWDAMIEQQNDNYYRDNKLSMMEGIINSLQQQIIMQNKRIRNLEYHSKEYNKIHINISENQVGNWLKNVVDLEEYISVFVNNGFDNFDAVKQIEMKHLESIGIDKLGHRLQLIKYIQQLE
eukprot:430746_1